jgi:hypothetical protein
VAALIQPAVAIVTNERDVSADWVVRALRAREVPFLRINTERLPDRTHRIDPVRGEWIYESPRGMFDVSGLRSIWYRRPEAPQAFVDDGLTSGELEYVNEQWGGVVDGLASLRCKWVNPPHNGARAESKILQLAEAASVGLVIPDTVVTNQRSEALRFMNRVGGAGVVIKALSSSLIRDGGAPRFVFTEAASIELLASASEMEAAPFIIQAEVAPKQDVRVTVVGERVFAARLSNPVSLDWRRSHDRATFSPHVLPDAAATMCVELVERMGLRFAAIDFVLSDSGDYYFLELNQNGEWGWLQQTCGLPIAEAIADELVS